jgi:hypothetical protein
VTRKLFVVVAVFAFSSVVTFGQSKNDLLMGTWKLNVEKSKFSPGPGPKSQTLKWEPQPTGFNFSAETVNAQGQATHVQNAGTVDGKPYMVKGATLTMTRITKRIDEFNYEETDSVDGKLRTSRRAVMSKDGKTMTVTTTGTNAQGQQVNNVTVYEKQ